MTIVSLVVALIVVGLLLWVVGLIPMDAAIHQLIRAVVIVAVVVWLILHLVPLSGFANTRIGH
jgi:hypothetical protein